MARRLETPERRKPQLLALPIVCVQCINTDWTKQSRSGPGAALRNQVPEALPLPSVELKEESRHLSHRVDYGERNDFDAPMRARVSDSAGPPREFISLIMTLDSGNLLVSWQYQYSQGAPERRPARLPALYLQTGQWGRVQYNGRQLDHDNSTWSYERWVYNVGLFATVTPSIFLDTEPVKVFSQMAHLW